MKKAQKELRFGFGENWTEFENSGVGAAEIKDAEKTLRHWIGLKDLRGKTFLDIGERKRAFQPGGVGNGR